MEQPVAPQIGETSGRRLGRLLGHETRVAQRRTFNVTRCLRAGFRPIALRDGRGSFLARAPKALLSAADFPVSQTSLEGRFLWDSEGLHDTILEPAENARPRRISRQRRPFGRRCVGSSHSGIFPLPPVTTPISVSMNGKGGVGNVEKSSHNVDKLPLKNKRSPVAVKRETPSSPASLDSIPSFAGRPGTVQGFPSGANSRTAWRLNLPALPIPAALEEVAGLLRSG